MSYSQFRLNGALLKVLKQLKEDSPNPTQKQLLKKLSEGGDVIISAPLKDNAELAAVLMTLNQCIKDSAWTGTKILYLTSDQKRVEKALKWLSSFVVGIEEFSVEGMDVVEAENSEALNLSKLSKGSTLIVSTPESLVPLVEKQDMVFRGLKVLLVENGTKISDFTLLERLFPRLMGGVQTIIQLSRPSEALLNRYKTLLGDCSFIEVDTTPEKDEKKAKKSNTESNKITEKESEEKPVSHVKRSTLEAKKSVSGQTVTDSTSESDDVLASVPDATPSTHEGEKPEETLDITQLLESLKEVTFKTLTIPDHTQIQAFDQLFEQEKEKKTIAYVIGSFEADSIFKELRIKDARLVSVHSKLRRNTYEYRMSRFFSGELNLAVIGGNLKTLERPEGVERVIFTNPPKSSDQFFRKLSRVAFSASHADVVVLIQTSQESEFLKWAIQTGLKFTPIEDAAFKDLKPVERKKSDERRYSGDQAKTAIKSSDSQKAQGHPSKAEDSRGSRDRSDRKNGSKQADRSQNRSNRSGSTDRSGRQDRSNDRSDKSSRGKGPHRPDRNRHQKGKSDRDRSPYKGGESREEPRRRPEEPKKTTPYGLPAASYDRLERGRSGKKESKGLLGAIKKLFGGD